MRKDPTTAAMATRQDSALRALRMPLVVLGVGLLSILLVLAVDRLRHRSMAEDTAQILALGEIQLHVATSHLWVEEHVSGDQVDLEQVRLALGRATFLIGSMLGEVPAPEDMPDLQSLDDTPLLQLANNLRFYLDNFRRISEERLRDFEAGLPVGIGSREDVEYDRVFGALLTTGGEMGTALEARRQVDSLQSARRHAVILAVWGVLVAAFSFGLWRRERRRQQAEEDLSASRSQLLQSQKMEAVGRLADGIAHDINNYLASIRSGCEIVRMRRGEDDWLAAKMDTAVATVEKAASLIERLLAFSRRQPVRARVVSLNRAVEGLEPMMRRLIGADIDLETHLAPELWPCEIDLPQLEQVVVNLLVNARDAMPTGGSLILETGNESASAYALVGPLAARDRVLLRVTDNGTGIPRAVRDKIFEPFFTTKESTGGSGLGLSTVYGVLRQNGGEISVDSEEGQGSRFEIRLPRYLGPEKPIDPLPSSVPESAVGGEENILLVDDNESFRESTEALLRALGYSVTSAASGTEALAAIEDTPQPFDVILSDVVMPGLGGRQLLEQLGDGHIPLVFMSGYNASVLERHGIRESDVEMLKKPFSATQMTLAVRRVLARTREAHKS